MASPDHDATKDSAKNQPFASEQEAAPPEEESTPGGEQVAQKKRGKKRRREEKEVKEGKKKKAALTASPLERPSRERKSVVRYTATASPSIPATKAVKIQQGPGEMLKDIPNVTFKLSKRKADESLRVLHKLLYGRKANVHFLKRNILQFSGFVWSQNEEKERSKVKEKLNKCNKERLLDFCDLLDVYTLKITTKKEEISAKLLEFLESPHATREVILSEKDTKGKKRRRSAKGIEERPHEEASSDKENTRPKKDDKHEPKKAHKKPAKGNKEDQVKSGGLIDDINDESEDKKDDTEEIIEHSKSEAEENEDNENKMHESAKTLSDVEEIDEHEEPKSKRKSSGVRKVSRTKSKKGPSPATAKSDADDNAKVSSESKPSKGKKGSLKIEKKKPTSKKDSKDSSTRKAPQKKDETDSGSGVSHRSKKVKEKGKSNVETASKDKQESKKQIEKTEAKEAKENKKKIAKAESKDVKENKKQIAKTKSKNVAKKKGKPEDVVGEPSTEQLLAVVSEILKEVDFNVATLADIIRQLGAHFNTDLMHRKTEIKGILEEVINNMTDDEEDEDEDGDDDGAE